MQHSKNSSVSVNSRFIKPCTFEEDDQPLPPYNYLIFGGYGDLAQRKIFPAMFHIFSSGIMPDSFTITGIGRRDFTGESYRQFIRNAVLSFCENKPDTAVLDKFITHVSYHCMKLTEAEDYSGLKKLLKTFSTDTKIIFYLAVPPDLSPQIISSIGQSGIASEHPESRIIIEKPFGEDKTSAIRLNNLLSEYFPENRIYRMDHYLGKETVQNIIFFRFANSIFEPIWNYKHIDSIQITAAETLGIEHRGEFYEKQGIIRDIIQNHMMQLISLIAMEAPAGFEADSIRNEKLKILKAIRPVTEDDLQYFTVGQYDSGTVDGTDVCSYRKEKNVSENSNTPTFVSGRFFIDTWRWAGVPFYFRAGKRLKKRATEIAVQFHQPPLKMFGRSCDAMQPNLLVFKIQPEEEIILKIGIKEPGKGDKIFISEMKFSYRDTFKSAIRPSYERQIIDSIYGDLTLFARQDSIEAMWDIVDPVIKYFQESTQNNFPNYKAGSWGPEESLNIFRDENQKWHTE
ncbi:MAG: glucose-6-phosphate dehydrogenase [Spirochaetes bacterium]|nr:glucose-6-phosphate dehydrogenase [Spirochaetota bacterium]